MYVLLPYDICTSLPIASCVCVCVCVHVHIHMDVSLSLAYAYLCKYKNTHIHIQISWTSLSVASRIGVGNFAEVLQGTYKGKTVAVKQFLQQQMSSKVNIHEYIACMYVCVCVYIYIYIYVYIYIYIYIYIIRIHMYVCMCRVFMRTWLRSGYTYTYIRI